MKALASMSKIIHRSIDGCVIGVFCRLSARAPEASLCFTRTLLMPLWTCKSAKQVESFKVEGVHMCSHVLLDYASLTILISILPLNVCSTPRITYQKLERFFSTPPARRPPWWSRSTLAEKVEQLVLPYSHSLGTRPGLDALSCPAMVRKDWSKSKMVRRIKQWPWSHRWTQWFSNVSATNDVLRFLKSQKHGHSTPLKSPHTQKYT